MKEYLQPIEQVLEKLETREQGLNSNEARQRLEKNGKNKLEEADKVSLLIRLIGQLKDPMVIILIVAAVLSGVTAAYSGDSFADVVIILAVVVINAVLGVYQESKAERAIEALQTMTAATSRVIRDGKQQEVKSEDLVVGDIVVLEAGDSIPMDGRILSSASMKIEESALTGESVPSDKSSKTLDLGDGKDISLGDRKNMVYMGTTVVYGHGTAVVTATGMDTEMGKIADAITQAKEHETPLQIKLNELSKVLSWGVVGISVFIFFLNIWRQYPNITTDGLINTFMLAISLAVAAIPEGLSAVVTIVLSIGVTKMSNRKAVIRKLTAVETLGSTSVICSDKTGTLTQNKMTVTDYYGDDEKLLAEAMALCNDAYLNDSKEGEGEPTEAALINYAYSLALDKGKLEEEYPRVGEVPFDSGRKLMSTIHQVDDKRFIQYTKGAPDVLLDLCNTYWDGTSKQVMTEEIRNEILEANKKLAGQALRVLSAATRSWDVLPENQDQQNIEKDLCFVGLTGMIDPVRPEVKPAIDECKAAGIRTVMITGDHKDTAVAIAKQLGIIEKETEAITGQELNEISDEQLEKDIAKYSVYARVQPEHKVRIVKAWQKNDKVVAMTGDGVNDAPSIKTANIGIGMGITGTDVTKNVADMVLADDNFATIVAAVEEGRRIYDNIRKVIQFLLGSNLSEVLSILGATLLGFTILRPTHLLWINLITDSIPAVALGMEEAEGDSMDHSPRDAKEGVFARGLGIDVIWQGAMVTCLTLAAYFIGHYIEHGFWGTSQSEHGITMAFLTLSASEMFHSINMRSRRKSIFTLDKHNLFLYGAVISSGILTIMVLCVPFLREAFDFTAIAGREIVIAIGLGVLTIPIVETVKFFQRRFGKSNETHN